MAVIGFVLLKFVFSLFGLVLSIAWTLLVWAAIGFTIYLLLKLIAPDLARRVREMVKGKEPEAPPAA